MLPRILYMNDGIAYTVNDGKEIYIEMNKHLCMYPSLYLAVLDHELEHVERGNTQLDFWIDTKMLFNIPLQWKLFLFCRKHPSARTSSRLWHKEEGKLYINWYAVILFSFNILVLILACIVLIAIT